MKFAEETNVSCNDLNTCETRWWCSFFFFGSETRFSHLTSSCILKCQTVSLPQHCYHIDSLIVCLFFQNKLHSSSPRLSGDTSFCEMLDSVFINFYFQEVALLSVSENRSHYLVLRKKKISKYF